MTDPRNNFDLSPQQYHAGLDKLWKALDVTGVQKDDVFTMASKEIQSLKRAVREFVMFTNEHIGDLCECENSFQCPGHAALDSARRIIQEGK